MGNGYRRGHRAYQQLLYTAGRVQYMNTDENTSSDELRLMNIQNTHTDSRA